MKKLVPLLVVSLLILSGFGAVGLQLEEQNKVIDNENENIEKTKIEYKATSYDDVIDFSEAEIIDKGNFVVIELEESTSNLYESGRPIIPVYSKTFYASAGSKLVNSQVTIDWDQINLQKEIKPAEIAQPMTTDEVIFDHEITTYDTDIYSSSDLYPSDEYTIRTGSGIEDGEHVFIVNVRCYAQYSPANNYIKVPKTIEIDLNIDEPLIPRFSAQTYDLLIITNDKFEDKVKELANHKRSIGIKTKVTYVDEIYSDNNYNSQYDWEEIKMYLADKVKTWGVDYVLFFGGRKGQTHEWWVPTFPSHNRDGATSATGEEYDPTYSCDLYFADVYYADQYGFLKMDDWDSNGNGIAGEGPLSGNPDLPDYYPDVYFGRIPLRYSWEADIIVDKIIDYDKHGNPSFKKAVLCGGDTSPPAREEGGEIQEGVYEGEIAADLTGEYLKQDNFQLTKCYTSENGDIVVREPDDVTPVISQGCGWVNMQTHSNPAVCGNFWPDGQTEGDFSYFYTVFDVRNFNNDGKYPFLVLDGCHSGQFNVAFQQVIDAGGLNFPRAHFLEYTPTDVSSWFVLQDGGGGIGAIGATGLGYGYINNGITQGLGGWISPRFAHAFAVQGKETIGEIWVTGITDYINIIGNINNDEIDRKTIEERAILGDPTIKLGGGSMQMQSDEEEKTQVMLPTANLPTWSTGQKWTYKIYDVDYSLHEVEGRDIDINLNAGNLNLEVVDTAGDNYELSLAIDSVDGSFDINFDPYNEEETTQLAFEFPPEVSITGKVFVEKNTMAIAGMETSFDIELDTAQLLEDLDINLPPIMTRILLPDRIPVTANLIYGLDDPFSLLKFPLDIDDSWPVEEAKLTLDGTIESKYLRVLKIINNVAKLFGVELIPDFIADQLPVIDISEFLDDVGIEDEFEVNEIEELFRKPPFEVEETTQISVPGGSYNCYRIEMVQGVGEMFYSSQVENLVKIEGNLHDFTPPVNDIKMELVSYS